jgi:phospholipid/cholesterol/gamma-HCH transport system substrate-binding protein
VHAVIGRAAIALQALAALVVLVFLLHNYGVGLPLADDGSWRVTAVFRDAGGLSGDQGASVLVAGVPSGHVRSVRYHHGAAIAELELDHSARGVVRADAHATIEPRSALNDLTVDLAPGSRAAPALRPGARIDAAHTSGPVALDRVVQIVDADTRAQTAVILDQLATGLDHRPGALRDATRALARTLDPVNGVAAKLSRRRRLLTRLVTSVDRIAATADRHRYALADVVRAGRATLDAVAAHDDALAATLTRLPPTIDSLTSATRSTRALAEPLAPALDDLRPAARAAPAAMRQVRAATPQLRSLVTALKHLEDDTGRPLANLETTARELGPAAAAASPAIAKLQPIVKAIDAHRDGVGLLGERFSGVLSTADANGVILRGLGSFEPFTPENLGFPNSQRAAAAAAAVTALTNVCRQSNPLACLVRYLVPGLPGSVRK